MAYATFNETLQIDISQQLSAGDKIVVNLAFKGTGPGNPQSLPANPYPGAFAATITSTPLLNIASTEGLIGYNIVDCPYLTGSGYGDDFVNTIVFTKKISELYGSDYVFQPNPLTGSAVNSLYNYYGDASYPFKPEQYDEVIMQASDFTFITRVITDVSFSANGLLTLTLGSNLPSLLKQDIINGKYKRFLLVKKYKDEQNIILEFIKPPGDTSYGFVLPDTISQGVVDNMNTLQAAVQKQLLSTQANTG